MTGRIPEPAWRTRPERVRRERAPLTRETIVEAALRVLDRDGMDALSMRRVAEALGTGPASLYWHVRNKEELLQLLFERLTAELPLPPPDPARWRHQLRDLARAMREQAHRHRDAARLSLGRVPSGPAFVRTTEWLFELLTPLGLPDQVIGLAGDTAALFVGAFAFEESLGVPSPTGEPLTEQAIAEMYRGYLQSLPADRFPHAVRSARALFECGPEERFEFGLDLLLRGLATYVQEDPASQSSGCRQPSSRSALEQS
ncbi:MAG: TetR/AcrR family transcriptional regulator C-terminal domain-containing protein [Candidatus Dormibacteraeota bacterium]|nr:TetR/AcrR family transcriptional regulator C-terminal domain-containing protein [Candidatus Dormibacteraeota bacterium]MBO0743381.1 TetR/AcrR family transcriptional regulator C-terminal domain-containing protein [Candidatus Dormibacteraeota bacterium]